MGFLRDLPTYPRLFRRLAAYFQQPQSMAESRVTIRRRIERREELFLETARDRLYAADSPYRPLLALAQCACRDLDIMVRQRGLEEALERLYRAGVYLSFQEFKSGGAIRRDGREFRVVPAQFNNPTVSGVLPVRSGGTRSAGTWSALNIEYLADVYVPQLALTLDMFGGWDAPILTWQLGFPSGAGIGHWFCLARLRRRHVRWFSLTPIPRGIEARRRAAFELAHLAAGRAGLRLPRPEFVPVGAAGIVLDAIRHELAGAGRCVMFTTPSCAVRLAAEAQARGESLRGVLFLCGSEALTPGKADEIRAREARVASYYMISEVGGAVGAPCSAPEDVDDMHFRSDALAMIARGRPGEGPRHDVMLITTLLPHAPKLLLNVEMDDFALIRERACGCVWDELGCRTHLVGLRSVTKLTGEGTTLLGTNVVHILEHILPAMFGGTSVDYQLVEAEGADRLTHLYLLVSPRLGPLDEAAVRRRFIEALDRTAGMPLGGRRPIWEQADSIRVLRRDPIPTGAGKLLPFHTLGAGLHPTEVSASGGATAP